MPQALIELIDNLPDYNCSHRCLKHRFSNPPELLIEEQIRFLL